MLATVIVVLAAVAAIVLIGSTQWRSRQPDAEPRRVWVTTRADSLDGATVSLEIEVVLEVALSRAEWDAIAGEVADRLETDLRQRILTSPVAALPSIGDNAGFLATDIMPGVRLLRAGVSGADVEITPQLRRLVTER